jgi:hypothetical protein
MPDYCSEEGHTAKRGKRGQGVSVCCHDQDFCWFKAGDSGSGAFPADGE